MAISCKESLIFAMVSVLIFVVFVKSRAVCVREALVYSQIAHPLDRSLEPFDLSLQLRDFDAPRSRQLSVLVCLTIVHRASEYLRQIQPTLAATLQHAGLDQEDAARQSHRK